MNRKITILLSALLATATGMASTLAGNDTINRMVLVESTYNPIVVGAVKRNFIPEAMEPSMKKESIVYADEAMPLARFERTPQQAKGAAIATSKSLPGYFHLGFGNRNNISGLAAYKQDFGQSGALTIGAHIDGWNGNIRLDEGKWSSRFYDMGIGSRYDLQLGRMRLGAYLDAERYTFNYLTLGHFDATAGYANTQRSGHVDAGVSLDGNFKEHYYYNVKGGYANYSQDSHLGSEGRNVEGHLYLLASLGKDLYEWGKASVDLRADWLVYKGLPGYGNYSSLGVTPSWDYAYDDFQFKVGMNLDLMTRMGAAVQVSPHCRVTYTPSKMYSAELLIDGGRKLPAFGYLHALSPYWSTTAQLTPSYTFLNVRLAGDARIMEGLHAHLGGGYKVIDNALFCTAMDSAGVMFSNIVGRDAQLIYADADISYIYKDMVGVSATTAYYHWMVRGNRALLAYTPQWDVHVKARARLMKGLYAHTDLRFVTYSAVEKGQREASAIDLSLGIHYAMNAKLSLFLDGHNLLNCSYPRFAGYPSQGINVLGGAVFKF